MVDLKYSISIHEQGGSSRTIPTLLTSTLSRKRNFHVHYIQFNVSNIHVALSFLDRL